MWVYRLFFIFLVRVSNDKESLGVFFEKKEKNKRKIREKKVKKKRKEMEMEMK